MIIAFSLEQENQITHTIIQSNKNGTINTELKIRTKIKT